MKRILLFIMFLSLTQSIFAKDPLTTSFEFLRNDFLNHDAYELIRANDTKVR